MGESLGTLIIVDECDGSTVHGWWKGLEEEGRVVD